MTNKTRLEMGAKVITLFIFGVLTIIVCAGILNTCPEVWVKWCAGFLLLFTAAAIFFTAKKVNAQYQTDESAKKK